MREDLPTLYVILDAELLGDSLIPMAASLVEAGVSLFQLRHKAGTARTTFEIAQRLVDVIGPHTCKGGHDSAPRGLRLIINDRPDVTALVFENRRGGGTHVGREDIAPDDARILCPQPMWVGVSTHNLEQVREADRTTADYVAFGPIFPTLTKANPDPVTGLELLREARKLTRKPLVAIGGITAENATGVFEAGADSVAVVRDILMAREPGERAGEFLKIAAAIERN